MAIALVQSTKVVVTSVNNQTLAYPSNVTAGNLLCNLHSHWVSGPAPGITTPVDTLTHTYAGMVAEQSSSDNRHRSFYVGNCSGGANTVTFDIVGTATGDLTAVIAEFSGAATSTPLGVTQSNTATDTAATSNATATLDQATGMLWGAISHTGADTTIAETGGASLVQENEGGTSNIPVNVSYELTTADTAQAATWTLGASRAYLAHVAFFKAAAAGGRTTRNTRAWTLGTQVGMGHRMPV